MIRFKLIKLCTRLCDDEKVGCVGREKNCTESDGSDDKVLGGKSNLLC